MIKVAESGK